MILEFALGCIRTWLHTHLAVEEPKQVHIMHACIDQSRMMVPRSARSRHLLRCDVMSDVMTDWIDRSIDFLTSLFAASLYCCVKCMSSETYGALLLLLLAGLLTNTYTRTGHALLACFAPPPACLLCCLGEAAS